MGPLTIVSGNVVYADEAAQLHKASMGPLTIVSGNCHGALSSCGEPAASMGPLTIVSGNVLVTMVESKDYGSLQWGR